MLHLDMCTPQGLLLDMSGQQELLVLTTCKLHEPGLHLSLSKLQWCAASGRTVLLMDVSTVYTTEACDAPGRVYATVQGPELHLDNRSLCTAPGGVSSQQGLELHVHMSTLQRPVLHLDVSTHPGPKLHLDPPLHMFFLKKYTFENFICLFCVYKIKNKY
jgi:hypothetical protein